MDPNAVEILVPLGFFAMIVAIVVGRPMVKALAARMEREAGQPKLPPEVGARLERMEQAIESIAVEVERISEGQRFTTRLLSETRGGTALPARSGGEQPR